MKKKPDIVIRDPRESKKKCSIYPLRDRDDLLFLSPNTAEKRQFPGYFLLHVDGPPLTLEDAQYPIIILDASWRWAERLALSPSLATLPKRSLQGFTTAYPRKSKLFGNPEIGLASLEALYIVRAIRQQEDPSLLEHYYWKEKFWQLNREKLSEIRAQE